MYDPDEWTMPTAGWQGVATPPVPRARLSAAAIFRMDISAARAAQRLREEAATHGGKTERQAFYGEGEYGPDSYGFAERRITLAAALRDRAAYDRAADDDDPPVTVTCSTCALQVEHDGVGWVTADSQSWSLCPGTGDDHTPPEADTETGVAA